MSVWREGTLGDVVELKRGYDLPTAQRRPGTVPIVSSSGRSGFHDEAKVGGPGVVTGRYGTLGEVFYIEEDFWPLNTALYVRDFKGNHPRYVAALLTSLDLGRSDGAAAVPGVNRNHLHVLPVTFPEPQTQASIADILEAFDDLIENNRRRIALLEQLAQAIYREWFVRFRYPGHEHDELVDSPLGPIPKGWLAVTLGAVAETQYGFTDSATQSPEGPKFLRVMDINKRTYVTWSDVPHCSPEVPERFRLRRGDVVIARMADPGKVGIIEQDVLAVFASYLVRLRPTVAWLHPYYLYFTASNGSYRDFIVGASTGTTRKSISAKVMEDGFIIRPPDGVVDHFVRSVTPLRERLTNLARANEALGRLRDLLLPKLVTGAIDVSHLDLDALLDKTAA